MILQLLDVFFTTPLFSPTFLPELIRLHKFSAKNK
jgi:hypothetical protein